jgi:chromatin assembly factor 1 subunit B
MCPWIGFYKKVGMQVKTVHIHWHERQPIYSIDFDPVNVNRLATAGGDNNVRVFSQ